MSVLRNAKQMRMVIRNKRHGMLTSGGVLIHENARPHTSTAPRTRALLKHFNWELFDYPSYCAHVVPSDYHLFFYLKNWLGSQCFNNDEEFLEAVKTWLSSQAANFFDTGIQKFIPRYDKCLNSSGVYVEKYLTYVRIFCI
jgi:hypothetical protein